MKSPYVLYVLQMLVTHIYLIQILYIQNSGFDKISIFQKIRIYGEYGDHKVTSKIFSDRDPTVLYFE